MASTFDRAAFEVEASDPTTPTERLRQMWTGLGQSGLPWQEKNPIDRTLLRNPSFPTDLLMQHCLLQVAKSPKYDYFDDIAGHDRYEVANVTQNPAFALAAILHPDILDRVAKAEARAVWSWIHSFFRYPSNVAGTLESNEGGGGIGTPLRAYAMECQRVWARWMLPTIATLVEHRWPQPTATSSLRSVAAQKDLRREGVQLLQAWVDAESGSQEERVAEVDFQLLLERDWNEARDKHSDVDAFLVWMGEIIAPFETLSPPRTGREWQNLYTDVMQMLLGVSEQPDLPTAYAVQDIVYENVPCLKRLGWIRRVLP